MDKLIPQSIQFTGVFTDIPEIQTLNLEQWLCAMLENKIVMGSGDKLDVAIERLSLLEDPYLIVQDTNPDYITRTLFQILKKVLNSNSTITTFDGKHN